MPMEAMISSSSRRRPVYKSLQSYWRRRSTNYQRIDEKNSTTNNDNKKRSNMVKLGTDHGVSERRRNKGSLKQLLLLKKVFVVCSRPVKVAVRVLTTPKRLLLGLRDSYIGAMHSWAGTLPVTEKKKKKIASGGTTTKVVRRRKEGEMSDFDKKMILHIYNTVMAGKP